MSSLLRLSRLIDWINERVGRSVMWLVLIAVVISAGNALVRKLFNTSSNALLEIQWYLFAAIFMLAAGYTFLRNEHVRIDILTSRLSPRGQNIVDILGIVFFLLPMAVLILWLSWPIDEAMGIGLRGAEGAAVRKLDDEDREVAEITDVPDLAGERIDRGIGRGLAADTDLLRPDALCRGGARADLSPSNRSDYRPARDRRASSRQSSRRWS